MYFLKKKKTVNYHAFIDLLKPHTHTHNIYMFNKIDRMKREKEEKTGSRE